MCEDILGKLTKSLPGRICDKNPVEFSNGIHTRILEVINDSYSKGNFRKKVQEKYPEEFMEDFMNKKTTRRTYKKCSSGIIEGIFE